MPLCAVAYKYVFNTCRIPAPGQDVIGMWNEDTNNHAIVLANNCIYRMDLTKEMTPADILANLAWIQNDAKNHNEPPLGTLTAVHRDTWTTGRANLIKKVENKESLKVIESSAFAICLDEAEPDSQGNCARQMILDDGANRWYDKTLQLIVFANGRAGLYAEHALIDGSVITRVLTDSIGPIEGPVDEDGTVASPP